MRMKKIVAFLLVLAIGAATSSESFASIKVRSNRSNSTGNLKRLDYPGEFYVITNGVIFECWTTGVWNIELTDDYGEVIYSGTISAVANESYFLYVPGLDPDEDEIDGL